MLTAPRIGGSAGAPGRSATPSGASRTEATRSPDAAAIATYGVGCVVNVLVARWKGRVWAEDWGVPFAAGLVVGESLLAMTVNMIVLATG